VQLQGFAHSADDLNVEAGRVVHRARRVWRHKAFAGAHRAVANPPTHNNFFTLVILSNAKDLIDLLSKILHFVQNDKQLPRVHSDKKTPQAQRQYTTSVILSASEGSYRFIE